MSSQLNSAPEDLAAKEPTLFDRAFRDSEGKIVLAQPPNPPLVVWLVATLLQLIFSSGKVQIGLDLVAFGALFTWAWQELFAGVNYFRRALGLIVLGSLITFKIQLGGV